MKAVPSLVAASTVGAAATGLVFGREQILTPARPPSNKRKAVEYERENLALQTPRRSATGSTLSTPQREDGNGSSPFTNSSPNDAAVMNSGASPYDNVEDGLGIPEKREGLLVRGYSFEDSASSRGSWLQRRLSTIQTSAHNSPRSSVGPDSPSLTFSHGSTAPIIRSGSSPVQLLPNKLVKRSTSGQKEDGEGLTRKPSRSNMPSLRRPATSHQRSVTLHQQQKQNDQDAVVSDHETPSTNVEVLTQIHNGSGLSSRKPIWRPYFEARVTKLTKERSSSRMTENSPGEHYSTSRRILLPDRSFTAPALMKANSILESSSKASASWRDAFPAAESQYSTPISTEKALPSHEIDSESHKRLRRSLSINFTSPTSWISRSGSLRVPKSGGNSGKRNVSAPLPTVSDRGVLSSYRRSGSRRRDITDPSIYQAQSVEKEPQSSQSPLDSTTPKTRSRNGSSPLPPLSRLSSFNLDLGKLSSTTSGDQRHSPASPSAIVSTPTIVQREKNLIKPATPVVISQVRSPRQEGLGSDRGSTLIGSDYENRGFVSGDDEETDFASDTAYDSYRTGATGSVRSRNGALETMFDESPPSAGSKTKSPLPLDIAATTMYRESPDLILEEDEGMVTPIKERRGPGGEKMDVDMFSTPTRAKFPNQVELPLRSSPLNYSLATKDFARLSIEDDDEDEDWTKDDDSFVMNNSLSPASRHSGTFDLDNLSPLSRKGLNGKAANGSLSSAKMFDDRPKSVFDWSEPLSSEKIDIMGNSPRPRTEHGKQNGDARGGRSVGRRGPNPLHIRSQSVPVVPDVAGHREIAKMAPKFGTWGLGAKGISEDWDNDFEFTEADEMEDGEASMSNSAMLIPKAIQASQASVVGHVSQIREICLLVEDLKRLRGQGRDFGLLDGASAHLWREAEGIIALAIPEEEDQTLSPPRSPELDRFDVENRSGSSPAFDGEQDILQRDSPSTRRRSVFSPDDDIFGAGGVAASKHLQAKEDRKHSAHKSPAKDATSEAVSVMKHIHQTRAASDPLQIPETSNKTTAMPFDTTSLRDLVSRANQLRNTLAEIVRKADGAVSPHRSPMPDRESSPAFTQVFDPVATTPKHLTRTQSNHSVLSSPLEGSPSRSMGQRLHMMVV